MALERKKRTKPLTFNRRMKQKLMIVFAGVMCALIGLTVVLARINIISGREYERIVLSNRQYNTNVVPYKRGDIVDRNGTVLATSEEVYNVIIDASELLAKNGKYREASVESLVKYLGIDINTINEYLDNEENKDAHYKRIARKVPYKQIKEYMQVLEESNKIKGIWLEKEYKRTYPQNALAGDLIGFTVLGDDGEDQGNWGIEQYYNDELSGKNGVQYGYVDSELNYETVVKSATDGYTIVSTIDANLQSIVQKDIEAYYAEKGAKNLAVIIADPNNGEILAEASYPFYDLNNPQDLSVYLPQDQIDTLSDEEKLTKMSEMWRNFCISDTYEPGSTFKPFTIAAALEENIVTDNQSFYCDGFQDIYGTKIKCHKTAGHGMLTLEESLMNSCNDALMQIGASLGTEKFCKYVSDFGFGLKTNIDLPGETYGIIHTADTMGPVDLAVNSFGQGINVTMTQMVAAFSSLINGGNFYEPSVVKRIETQGGNIVDNKEPVVLRQTVTAKTSELLRRYLYSTVAEGTAKTAGVEGYAIGGKTGTAEKYPRGNEKYIVSFIGFAPVDNPKYVIYVVIDEPNVEKQSDSTQATTLAQKIMSDIMPYMNIYPTNNTGDNGQPAENEEYESGGFIEGENVTDPIAEQAGTHVEGASQGIDPEPATVAPTEPESQSDAAPSEPAQASPEDVAPSEPAQASPEDATQLDQAPSEPAG